MNIEDAEPKMRVRYIPQNESGTVINDVHSPNFKSNVDPFFTSKTKVKDHGRKCSIKIFGQWT